LKDGKIVVKNSGNFVPHTPLSPDGAAALAAAERSATGTPSTTIPKPPTPEIKSDPAIELPAITPVVDVQGDDAVVFPTKQAPATTKSASTCHDFWSCFSQNYSQAAANSRAIAKMEQQNRRLAAENQKEERRLAERTFNDLEEIRKDIAHTVAGSAPDDPPMVKALLQQMKDSWSNIRKIYCEHAPQASYIDLDGNPQRCAQAGTAH